MVARSPEEYRKKRLEQLQKAATASAKEASQYRAFFEQAASSAHDQGELRLELEKRLEAEEERRGESRSSLGRSTTFHLELRSSGHLYIS